MKKVFTFVDEKYHSLFVIMILVYIESKKAFGVIRHFIVDNDLKDECSWKV